MLRSAFSAACREGGSVIDAPCAGSRVSSVDLRENVPGLRTLIG